MQNNLREKYNFLTACLINLIFFTLFFVFITPAFETNDDAGMMLIASGFMSGQPDEFILLMHVFIGKALKLLYGLTPAINWYALFLYFFHFTAMLILQYVFLSLSAHIITIVLFSFLFILFELPLLTKIQFTSTAFVLGMSGLLLLLSGIERKGWINKRDFSTSLLLLITAGLIRWQVFVAVTLVFLPILIFYAYRHKSMTVLAFIAISFILFFPLTIIDDHFYIKEGGKPGFLEYNTKRELISDYPLHITDEILRKNGWNQNDLELFKHWFYVDPNIYSKERIMNLAGQVRSTRSVYKAIRSYGGLLIHRTFIVLTGVFCLLFAYLYLPRQQVLFLLIFAGTVAGVVFALLLFAKLPNRVFFPIIFIMSSYSFFLVLRNNIMVTQYEKKFLYREYIMMGAIIISAIWQLFQVNNMSGENGLQKSEFELALSDLNKHKDKLFVVVGGGFPYESVRVFQNPALNSSFNMLGTGTDIGLPYYKSILNKHKITNLITALYLRKNILIIGGTEPYLQSLKQFIYDHYRVEVYFAEDKNNFTHLMPIKVIQAQ